MFKTKALKEKRNDLITRAEKLVNTAEMEQRELTEAEAAELAEIRDNVKAIKDRLELLGDLDDLRDTEKNDAGAPVGTEPDATKAAEDATKAAAEERAFEAYIREKALNIRAGDPVNFDKTENGDIIPTTIAKRIIKKVWEVSPILQRAMRYDVTGNLVIPYYDESDTAITVGYQEEFVDIQSSAGKFDNSIKLSGFLAGALSKISNSLINNAAFDIVAFVVEQMGISIARWIEGELLHGTSDKVEGLSTLTNTVETEAEGVITGDDLINLQDSVIDIYQQNAIWIMSSKTRTALRKLKDDVGRYLLNDDITSPFGKVLLGKPVYVSDNMPEIASANGKPVIFYGDFKGLAVKFSEQIAIKVLRELFAAQHATGVIGWFEFDAKVQDSQCLASLTMNAGE